jgi:TonB-linked SusC/RagA family outer membrane protein
MKEKFYKAPLLMLFFVILCTQVWAQERIVGGQVTDEMTGESLPGVNIMVKGSSSGAVTDLDGNYSLEVSGSTDTLVFSFIGYITEEIQIGNRSSIDIALVSDLKSLEEVVVVGYGEQSRATLTSAVSKLDTEALASAPQSNVGSALQGTVSGLQVVNTTGQPGAAPSIILRGGASINSPGSPLVVVDGVIRSYNDIAPEDIESIELLKDAASTAIYGARANNGVILITTKQGKAGKAEISYKFTGGYNKRREGYQYFGAKDFIYYNRLGNLNSGRTLDQVNSSRGYGLLTDPANLASFDIRRYDASTEHLLEEGWELVDDPYGGKIIFKDHGGEVEDLVFRDTYTKDHYISVTGGNDKGKYFASFDYYNEDGIIVGSEYKRYTGKVNGSYRVRPNVEVSTGVSLSTSAQTGTVGDVINTLYRNLAIWPTFNPWLDEEKTLPNPGAGITDGNPLYWLGKVQRSDEVNRITANGSVTWDILPSLYVKASGNVYLAENLYNSFEKATQNYSQMFASSPSFNTRRPAIARFDRDFQQQFNAIANYTKTFGDFHNVGAMLGSEYYGTKAYDMQVYGIEAPTDDIPTVNASTNFIPGNNYSSESEYRIISAFGRLNYDYNQRYLLTLVFRQDAVSSLAEENRVGFFPGMSAGWNVHREAFFQNSGISEYLSTFKPRVSYGENGNVAGLGRYEVQGAYGEVGLYDGNAGFLNTAIINRGLRWEQSRTTDIGLDVGFLEDRITLIFDYFNRKTTDLLTNLSLPSYTGFNSIRTNLGTYQNEGYEFTINANILNQPDGLKLDIGANASFVKNEILELPYNGNERNRQGGFQIYDPAQGKVVWVGGLQEGGRLGDIYAFKQVSIFRDEAEVAEVAANRVDVIAGIGGPEANYGAGKITPGDVNWLDVDENDTIDSRDQVYMGNIYPKWTGGFNASLAYKGFSLYSRFDFAFGHTIYNDLMARTLGNFQGTFNYFDVQERSWSPTNRDTDIPKVYYADQVSAPLGKKNYTRSNNAYANLNSNNSRFYEKGDYLACREITLSYNFGKGLLDRTNILSRARVYVSGSNLFYITKFSGATPEPPTDWTGITGVYRGTYPTPRTYTLGVQVSF